MAYYHLTGVDQDKREIYVASADETVQLVIDASNEAWTGKDTDIEVVMSPDGATVFYYDADGGESFKNYRFSEEGVQEA